MKTFMELLEETKPFTKEDRTLSWIHLLSTITILAFSISVTTEDRFPIWIRIASSFIAGLTIVRGFIIYHDYQHGAIFTASKPAKWILSLYGILCLNPPSIWKRSHNYHHKNNSQIFSASIGSFPIMTKEDYRDATPWTRLGYRLARHPMTILFGYVMIFMIGMCLKSFMKDPKRHYDSAIALALHFFLMAVIAPLGWTTLILSFILPIAISCAAGAYLFYIQHNFPDMKLKKRTEWSYYYAALHSSSYMEGSFITHWFTGNIGYHHVHHLNPLIPFYRLPEAMAALPELQNPGRTNLSIGEIYRCLQLKVWDETTNRMLTFEEAYGPESLQEESEELP